MKKTTLEKIVEKGISFLSKIFPIKSYLHFPLLSAAVFWGIRRATEWKKEILSWQVYLDPERIVMKPYAFVLNFFENHSSLNQIYQTEIMSKDEKALREAFNSLYPILGLEDPFLSALFYEDLKSSDYRKIAEEFKRKVSLAKKDIEAFEGKSRLLEVLETVAEEAASLSLELMSNDEVQDVVANTIKKWKNQGN
ncbi:MAG: hypothetical protein GTN73_09905 [Candidatus Aminicenantes bacterium]|nr:hypothetical protein [Candidatus Aminicenantes bacterium]